jgi:hypothetical protein
VTGDFKARARATIQQKDMRAARDQGVPERQVGGDLEHSALVLAIDPEGWDHA